MNKKLLVVDDHPIILNGLKTLFGRMPGIILTGGAVNGKLALQHLEEEAVDILVTDLNMPVMDGFELIEKVKKLYPSIRILVLSMHDEVWRIKRLLDLEVSSILVKSAPESIVKEAIEAICRGESYFDKHTKDVIVQVALMSSEDKANATNSHTLFTEKEIEVLNLIFKGFTSKEISTQVNKSISTVESHRRNMFAKADVRNVAGLLNFALKKGYILT